MLRMFHIAHNTEFFVIVGISFLIVWLLQPKKKN